MNTEMNRKEEKKEMWHCSNGCEVDVVYVSTKSIYIHEGYIEPDETIDDGFAEIEDEWIEKIINVVYTCPECGEELNIKKDYR